MHLIDTNTLKLTWFPGKPPRYAILSHTWNSDELSFADFCDSSKRESLTGFQKIKLTCRQARHDGLGYAWIDTCCIDKESSAELSEAINTMFRWYRDAAICYTYIEDLPDDVTMPITNSSPIKGCRWFSRGWTLQELLAPENIIFFGPRWDTIGCKADLLEILEEITRVPRAVLAREDRLDNISVADRMNWAARRQTTREEDMAYCLMGIFDVNMPMIYGEGGQKAFVRLQEEIVKQRQDDSLFAWRTNDEAAARAPYRGLFASSPAEFASDVSITPFYTSMAGPTTILGDGHVSLSCVLYNDNVLALKCHRGTDVSNVVGIRVINMGNGHYLRSHPSELPFALHKNPAVYNAVTFEKYVERTENEPLKDVYLCDGLHLANWPEGMKLVAFHPKEYKFQDTTMVPVVYIVDKKIAFEFAVDTKTIGADVFRFVGRDKELLGTSGDIHVLLVVYVKQLPGTKSYAYYFRLHWIRPGHAQSSFDSAECPLQVLQRDELKLGWCMLQVQGGVTNAHGQMMFSFATSLTVCEDVKGEIMSLAKDKQDEQDEQDAEDRRLRVRSEPGVIGSCLSFMREHAVVFFFIVTMWAIIITLPLIFSKPRHK